MNRNKTTVFIEYYEVNIGNFPSEGPIAMELWGKFIDKVPEGQFSQLFERVAELRGNKMAYPRVQEFKSAWYQISSERKRTQYSNLPSNSCAFCTDGTLVVPACPPNRDVGETEFSFDEKTHELRMTAFPCMCSAGDRKAEKWQIPLNTRHKAHNVRKTLGSISGFKDSELRPMGFKEYLAWRKVEDAKGREFHSWMTFALEVMAISRQNKEERDKEIEEISKFSLNTEKPNIEDKVPSSTISNPTIESHHVGAILSESDPMTPFLRSSQSTADDDEANILKNRR